jgi:BirA family biotin operon repressor/biotin-[acetyl-CoA-carboxylase] ligase
MRIISLANPFGAPVFHEKIAASTMDSARVLAQNDAPHGTVVVADEQEAGRGRGGRIWRSDAGANLLCTLILRFPVLPDALTLKAGLGTALAIEDYIAGHPGAEAALPVQVKWPNDLMIGKRKAAGILCEGERGNALVGIGVNFNQLSFPEELREKAVSLACACGAVFPPEGRFRLLERILGRIHAELSAGDETWRARLVPRLYMLGKEVRFIPGAAGASHGITGRLEGIGPQGELRILPDNGSPGLSYTAGELDASGPPAAGA